MPNRRFSMTQRAAWFEVRPAFYWAMLAESKRKLADAILAQTD